MTDSPLTQTELPEIGVLSQVVDGGLLALRSLDTLGGRSRWVQVTEIVEDLNMSPFWRGRATSVARVLTHHRDAHRVRSRMRIKRDNGNEMASQLEWRITSKGRAHAWR